MRVRLLTPVLAVALLTSCAGSDAVGKKGMAAGSSPQSSSAPSQRVSARQVDPNGFPLPERPDCAENVGGDFVRATTSQGNGVGFLLIGRGTRGVVLAPQSGGDICQWLPYAEELATRYRVALFDWKEPQAELPVLAVAALRHAGVRKVVLGGASLGGALAMSEAHRVRPRLAGVLSFSGELALRGDPVVPDFDGRSGIKKWRGPLLALGSTHDSYFDSGDARELRVLHPGPETVVMLPGYAHGVSTCSTTRGKRVCEPRSTASSRTFFADLRALRPQIRLPAEH
jgi:dienelactone hydrolase